MTRVLRWCYRTPDLPAVSKLSACSPRRHVKLFGSSLGAFLCFAILSVSPFQPVRAEKIEFERARALATNICSQCHLFPEPNLLDRTTWRDQIRPLMRKTMDVAALENNPSPTSRVLLKEWDAIWDDFYLVAAPEKALPQDSRPPILPDLTLFKVEDPCYQPTNSYATMLYIDNQAHQLYVGNALT